MDVVLLLADLKVAQDISLSFREKGHVPAVFTDFSMFWEQTLKKVPDLAIIDVALMGQGERRLIDHPKIQEGLLPIAFYIGPDFFPLLSSTRHFAHLGIINKAAETSYYTEQLFPIVLRAKQFKEIKERWLKLKNEQSEWEKKALLQVERSGEARAVEGQWKLLTEWDLYLEKSSAPFLQKCADLIEKSPFFDSFMMLIPGPGGQKILSVETLAKKHKAIPSLWAGESCEKGLGPYAQNLITQVSLDILGENAIPLFIRGIKEWPTLALIFVMKEDQFITGMDWILFESVLSGHYIRGLISSGYQPETKVSNFSGKIDAWELMAKVDAYFFEDQLASLANKQTELFDIDLRPLLSEIRKRPAVRFFWQEWIREFGNKLAQILPEPFYWSTFGVEHIAIFVTDLKSGEVSTLLQGLKEMTAKFPMHRFFEDSENSPFYKDIQLHVRCVAVSPEAYLRHVHQGQLSSSLSPSPVQNKSRTKTNLPFKDLEV